MTRPGSENSIDGDAAEPELDVGGGSLLDLPIGPRVPQVPPGSERRQTIGDLWRSLGRGRLPAAKFIDWNDLVEQYDDLLVLRCSNPDQGTIWEIHAISDSLRRHPVLSASDHYSLFAEWLLDLGRQAAIRRGKVVAAEGFAVSHNGEVEIVATIFPFGQPQVTHAVCRLSSPPVTN